jgi:general secretion pathway protein F/type IV pilus assembly protein PilC
MPAFTYTALSPSGQQVTGKLSVGSRAEAFRKLEAQSLTPVKVVEDASAGSTGKDKRVAQAAGQYEVVKLKRAQIILFTEEMADLLDGGLQIDQALRVMEERQEAIAIKKISSILRNEVREGATISKALRKASPSFDDLYINMVAAGEASGSLPEILRRLAAGLTVIQELQGKVTQAMIYPALLIVACICLLIVFMTVLIPQLTSLLADSGTKLPLATELLMKFSAFFGKWWWLMGTVCVAGFLLFRGYINTPAGRMWWDQTKFKLPLFGPVISTRLYAQFAHSLGNLVVNGVPLLNGLKLSTRAMSNVFIQSMLVRAVALVGEGASLSNALRKVGEFPTLLVDMIAVGEQTGTLGRALEKSAVRYDKELDKRIKRLTTLISPAIMIFMAAIVGVVAYSIVTAIFQASNGIRSNA